MLYKSTISLSREVAVKSVHIEGVMRLTAINCIVLACAAAALADELRPRRHLHQIKEMIINKLVSSSEPNCSQPTQAPPLPPPQLETRYFRIPGFNHVVIKAVPKGSTPEPALVELPPNSEIGVIGSYLGTSTLNETYNALLGVKNLLTSGILSAKRDVVQKLVGQSPQVQIIATAKPIQPCAAPVLSPPPLEPVKVLVTPPKVPVVPTQYSYKQVNQDGSVTTHTSTLELDHGVRVTEAGKTLPLIIDRVRKVPVHLPVPVLPEISKIIVSEVPHPISSYAYQQIHQDGRITSYMGLPALAGKPGPVVVTNTGYSLPPPPGFLMDRIEKVAAIASFPRAFTIDGVPKPVAMRPRSGYVIRAPVPEIPLPAPGPTGYSYSQMGINGGVTTHSASGVNAPVLVAGNGLSGASFNGLPSLPEKNPFRYPASSGSFSYSQVHAGGEMTSFNGGVQAGPVNVIEHRPLSPVPVSPVVPLPPNSFSYKQVGDGRMTTYTGSGIYEETVGTRPAVVVHGVNHPGLPPHISDRIEKVAAGAKFNRPPYSTMPFSNPFTVPVPTGFVRVPTVNTSVPQRPVKIPTTSGMSSFVYKHVHNDGSVTSYGRDGAVVEENKKQVPPAADMTKPFPQGNVRVFESPMYSGPFPMNPINPNAVKPSTPVSGSYSYKMVHKDMRGSHPPLGPIDGPIVDTFAAPPSFSSIPAPIQNCVDPDITNPVIEDFGNPMVGPTPVLFEKPVPITYSYKQMSHSNPNPFLVVNVEDPVMDLKKVNMKLGQPLPTLPPLANPFPTVNVVEHKPVVPAPIVNLPMPGPHVPKGTPPPSSFSYKQVTSQGYQPLPSPQPAVTVTEHKPTAFLQPAPFAPPPMTDMRFPLVPSEMSPPSSFSYKQVTSQGYQPMPSPQPAVTVTEHKPTAFVQTAPFAPPPMTDMRFPLVPSEMSPPSSFPYKQVTSQGYQPLPSPPQPAVTVTEHKPTAFAQPMPFAPPPMSDMRLAQVPTEAFPPASFSYKQVTSQAYQPVPPPQPAVTVTEHKPTAFMQHEPFVSPSMSDTRSPHDHSETSPTSSFSYKQVTNPAYQPQPAVDVIEHRPNVPAVPPPMINTRGPQIQKANTPPSSFSYKQVTDQGLYEYSDEFPTGVKTNLPPRVMNRQRNPSGNVYVEEKRLSPKPMPVLADPMPIPAIPVPAGPTPPSNLKKPVFNRQNSLANNPIVVQEQSSFSFKSSNPDGSTITVKDDGHNSIAVQVEEASRAEEPQETSISVSAVPASEPPMEPGDNHLRDTSSSAPETTPAPISGHAKPTHRHVLKRKRPLKQRGDIPEAAE